MGSKTQKQHKEKRLKQPTNKDQKQQVRQDAKQLAQQDAKQLARHDVKHRTQHDVKQQPQHDLNQLGQQDAKQLAKIEQALKERIIPDLKDGRDKWDRQHTLSVVNKMKQIIKHSSANEDINTKQRSADSTEQKKSTEQETTLDPIILVIAAYAHDWGYSSIAANLSHKERKIQHMEESAAKLAELLEEKEFAGLTDIQKKRMYSPCKST
jgi:hypothetical protein